MSKFLPLGWPEGAKKLAHAWSAFAGYFISQVGLQILGMATGFLIIRALTKDAYANYTIITTLGPVMLLLSDSGISTSISAIGRHAWQANEKMGQLINTALRLRRTFALLSFVVVIPLLAWMLVRNHASIPTIVLTSAATLAAICFQLTTAVMRGVLQLRQKIKTQVIAGVAPAFLRLGLIIAFAVLLHLDAFLAVFSGTCAAVLEAYLFVRAVKPQVNWNAAPNPEYRASILSIVKKTLPLTVYFCVQGQISIWLISIFGHASQVADIGAAARLGVVFTSLTASYGAIVVPRFARNNGRRRLFLQSLQIVGSLLLILLVFVAFAKFFPSPLILLLGSKYENMAGLLWLVVLSSGLSALAGVIFKLNTIKGWIPPAIVTIPVEILTQIVLLLSLDLSRTESVLIFGCVAPIPPTLVNAVMLLRRIRREVD
jgi:O-antigen/teichoic acid export membrane protein